MRSRICLAVLATALAAFGYLKSVEVLPTQASWSGWTDTIPPNNCVGNTFTANFDSLAEVQFFAGDTGGGGQYRATVTEWPGGTLITQSALASAQGSHTWVKFNTWTIYGKFVRGKEYLLKVTRPGDSINWYKDICNKYPYGHMVGGSAYGQPPPQSGDDLCARIYGKARVGDEFSVQSVVAWPNTQGNPKDTATWSALVQSERDLGVRSDKLGYGFGVWTNPDSGVYHWDMMDSLVGLFADAGISMPVQVGPGPWAASDLHDGRAIARRLFAPVLVNGQINDGNLLGRYMYEFAKRYGPYGVFWQTHSPYVPIMIYESGSEPDQAALGRDSTWNGYWKYSCIDFQQYKDTIAKYVALYGDHEGRKRSFLWVYSRFVVVMDSAIKKAARDNGAPEGSLPRSACYIISMPAQDTGHTYGEHYSPGEWIQGLKDHGAGNCFDIASYHPYRRIEEQESWVIDTLRYYFSSGGMLAPRPFWVSECGYSSCTVEPEDYDTTWAIRLGEAFATIQDVNAIPGYPVEQWTWYNYPELYMPDYLDTASGYWVKQAITDSEFLPRPPGHAFKQWSSACNGAEFEGRVALSGGGASDRALQYRDSTGRRFWMCWRDLEESEPGWARLPSGTDTVLQDSLAYTSTPPSEFLPCALDGWYEVGLSGRPVIVREHASPLRPDLYADSIKLNPPYPTVGDPLTVHAWVTNRGNRETPSSELQPGPIPTYAVLFWNGESVAQQVRCEGIDTNETVQFDITINSVPLQWLGYALFSVAANPRQNYVELVGTDDNAAYRLTKVFRSPTGTIDAVMPPSHETDEPLLLCHLSGSSWEKDSTGSTPPDSVRLTQRRYSKTDSLLDSATTGWFWFKPDTAWSFLLGVGRYRVTARFKDGMDNTSPVYPDSGDTVVVFDSIPPTGSVVINSDSRFARVQTCTLGVAVADSWSGLRAMRIGLRLPNFTRNSGCAYGDGNWDFTGNGSGLDDVLSMARLVVGTSGTSTMYQSIPAESLQNHWGDSLHLTADVIVAMPDAGPTTVGGVRFGYRLTHADPALETLTVVANIPFSGGIFNHAGTSNLDTGFVITEPPADTFWQFVGGYVEASLNGAGTEGGTAWLDNVKLEAAGPYPEASWWRPCTTAVLWNLGSPCGIKMLCAAIQDSAGTESYVPLLDSVILDYQMPNVHIGCPEPGSYVDGVVSLSGYAYDPLIPGLDTFFEWRRLEYRHIDSTNWLPCDPDSVSFSPAYPEGGFPGDVYLGCWNTTELEDGDYFVRLQARDSAGNLAEDQVWVIVQNEGTRGEWCSGPPGGGSGMGEGSVYIGSANGCVLHLSDGLDSLGVFTVNDSGSAAYVTAILENGDSLLVLDARNRRIHKLSRTGQNRRRLVSNLTLPVALVRDCGGNLWLVDKGTHRIGKFRSNGTLVFTRGGQGQNPTNLNCPEAIAVRGSLVYVVDSRDDRIAVWDTSGNFQGSIFGDFENPTAIAVSDSGSIYVTDGADGKLKGITPRGGRFLTITEANGSRLKGLVFSENKHGLFTLAPQPNTVYRFRVKSDDSLPGGVQSQGRTNLPKLLTLSQPFPNPARTRLNISYALPRQTRVTLKLYDIAGKLVTTLANNDQKPGYYHVNWNRTDARGRSVPAGVYFCALAAEGQRFSRKVVMAE